MWFCCKPDWFVFNLFRRLSNRDTNSFLSPLPNVVASTTHYSPPSPFCHVYFEVQLVLFRLLFFLRLFLLGFGFLWLLLRRFLTVGVGVVFGCGFSSGVFLAFVLRVIPPLPLQAFNYRGRNVLSWTGCMCWNVPPTERVWVHGAAWQSTPWTHPRWYSCLVFSYFLLRLQDLLLLRIMSSQYSLVKNGVYVIFFLDVSLLFANLACARSARGTPWRRRAPPWVCFLHLLPMRALPRTGLNLYTVSRCTFLVAPRWT